MEAAGVEIVQMIMADMVELAEITKPKTGKAVPVLNSLIRGRTGRQWRRKRWRCTCFRIFDVAGSNRTGGGGGGGGKFSKAAVAAVQVQVQAAVEAVQPCFIKQLLPTQSSQLFYAPGGGGGGGGGNSTGLAKNQGGGGGGAAAAMAAAMAEMLAELMQTVIKPLQ